jgi:hydrogenase expression/formation protein HypC
MCLAVAGKLIDRHDNDGTVDVRGNRVRARLDVVPEAVVGDFVLLHAGFAITVISPEEAAATDQAFEELERADPDGRHPA